MPGNDADRRILQQVIDAWWRADEPALPASARSTGEVLWLVLGTTLVLIGIAALFVGWQRLEGLRQPGPLDARVSEVLHGGQSATSAGGSA